MNGQVILLTITGLAAYVYCMSALGKWLRRCADASSAVAGAQTPLRASVDATAREKIAS